MIWLNDLKVRVSKLEDKGSYVKATLSTSEKKQDGTYEYSNWFANLVGGCVNMAKDLKEGDKITITKGKVSNVWNKEKKTAYVNMTVFGFTRVEKYYEKPNDDFSFSDVENDDLPWG